MSRQPVQEAVLVGHVGFNAEKLVSAKSLDTALEIQTDYVKQAYQSFVAQATRMSELYAEIAKDAYKPYESVVAKVVR